MGRHDSRYKLLFSYPHLVECLLRGFVPGDWLDRLDFDTLEKVSETLPRDDAGTRYDDVVWRLRWGDSERWIYIYLLLELQSTDPPFMAVRMFDYDAGLYTQIVRSLKLKRGDLLPVVLPVVLYRGQPAWRPEAEVFDLIEPAPPELRPYLPHLRYLLVDANAYPAQDLARMRNPVACMLWLEASQTVVTAAIDELETLLRGGEHAGLRRAVALWLTQAFLPSRFPGVTVPEVQKLEEVNVMITENAIDWSTQWREEGRIQGRQEGRQEGRQQGEAAVLLRQLSRRYGSLDRDIEERVRHADAEQLLEWADRFVTAASPDLTSSISEPSFSRTPGYWFCATAGHSSG